MSKSSSHLTLEELIAQANGEPTDIASRTHLMACAACQAEVRKWTAVGGGVSQLSAGARPSPSTLDNTMRSIGGIPMPKPFSHQRSRRRWTAVLAAAAAVALIGAGAYGYNAYSGSDSNQPVAGVSGSQTISAEALAVELTSTDCENVKVISGVLKEKNGSSIVLETSSGKAVTVTTSESTEITQQVTGSLEDIIEGSKVFVTGEGSESGSTVNAEQVGLLTETSELPGRLELPREFGERFNVDRGRIAAEMGRATGEVTSVDENGFTVTNSDGSKTEVATSASTKVTKQVTAGVSDLKVGEFTVAVGTPNDDGTFSATSVEQNTLTAVEAPSLHDFKIGERFNGELPGGERLDGELLDRLPEDLPRLRADGNLAERLPDGLFSGLGCNADTLATTAVMSVSV